MVKARPGLKLLPREEAIELVEHFVILHTYIAVIRTGSKPLKKEECRVQSHCFISLRSESPIYSFFLFTRL